MKIPYTNATFSIQRRTTTTGNKKADSPIETGIAGLLQDTGTTADHEQTYLIMMNADDVTSTLNADTDTINDGTTDYKIANVAEKRFTIQIRAIKPL
jgi:hypothetical protein